VDIHVGGKKLKGGVAMESPSRMNVIAELAMAGTLRLRRPLIKA
jgi:hypothetical protein